MNVANRKWIRRLSWKSLRAARTRNLVAVLAIALTTVLFTALFTIALSINDGFQQANFRQVGGWSHGGFKYLTEEQFLQLRDDPLIQEWGLRRFVGMPVEVPFNKSHVEVGYSDPNQAHWMYCDPVVGRLPEEGTDEAATDTRVLELLGITPQLGAEFTLTFEVDGHETTQAFTLCGWWEYDEAVTASHVLIPQSRVEAVLSETGGTPPGADGMTATWNMDVMLKSGSRQIAQDLEQILEHHGYQNESRTAGDNYIDTGVNWGYTGAQLSENLDLPTLLAVAALALLIGFTGYLTIYNVFQISVTNDIRFYGLLKTIGTTPRQLRRIIRHQALALSLAGIPHGAGGWLAGGWTADSGGHRPAGRCGERGVRGSGHLPAGRPVLSGDGVLLLPEAGPRGRTGVSGGGGALHRGGNRKENAGPPDLRRGVPALYGPGQSGPQPGQDCRHHHLPGSGGGAAECDRHLCQQL